MLPVGINKVFRVPKEEWNMYCISVSFKKTPVSIRQQFAFSAEEQKRFLSGLQAAGRITGGVVLSTCNRSEIYVSGGKDALEAVEDALASWKAVEKEQIKTYCLYYGGKKAVRHLFRVACGLDSMVLGEAEILRQVKEAYQLSSGNGFADGEIHIVFQQALHCAKQARSATRLSTTPVSIGTLTANAVEGYLREKGGGSILVIGATGKIGSIVAKDLMAKGFSVIGTKRSRHQGEEIFLSDREKMTLVDFDKRYDYVKQADAVISATSSPHYTLTRGEYERNSGKKECLLIDLAVPRDIDRELGKLDGITLYDIDFFENLSKENSNIKEGELGKAEGLLEECLEDVLKNLYIREFKMHMSGKKQEDWYSKMVYYLKEILDSNEFWHVLGKLEQGGGKKFR